MNGLICKAGDLGLVADDERPKAKGRQKASRRTRKESESQVSLGRVSPPPQPGFCPEVAAKPPSLQGIVPNGHPYSTPSPPTVRPI